MGQRLASLVGREHEVALLVEALRLGGSAVTEWC
jgi:hypothetical protein